MIADPRRRLVVPLSAFIALACLASTAASVRARAAGRPGAAADAQDDSGVRALIARLQQASQDGSRTAFATLLTESADRARASRFANEEIEAGATRVVVRESDRKPLPGTLQGDGYRLRVDVLAEFGRRARTATWQLDVRRTGPGEWRVEDEMRLSSMEGLYRLALNTSRQLAARNFRVTAEDLELTMVDGSVFTIDTDQGPTGLVLIGRGTMRFHPAPPAEKGQLKIFGGADALDTRFTAAYVRFGTASAHADLSTLAARPIDPGDARRAEQVFREESAKSFGLDLGDLASDGWSVLPPAADFLAEIRTGRFDTLTYSRAGSLPEDISFVDRRRQRTIAVYASAGTLAARGRFYSEDDLATYDVVDYNIEVEVTPAIQWIEGTATLRLKIRSAPADQLALQVANSLVVRSIVSDRFGRLFSVRVKNQNTVLVSLPAQLAPGSDLALTIAYGGRLPSQPVDQEALALQSTPMSGRPPTRVPPPTGLDRIQSRVDDLDGLTDESAFLRPETAFLYSNRSLWYPQAPVGAYATATMTISVPATLTCVASGEETADSPRLIVADDPAQSRKIFTFLASRPVRYLSFVLSRFAPAERATMAFDETPEAARAGLARDAPSMAGDYHSIDLAVLTNVWETARAREVAERAADIAQFYRSIVGDSPYQSFSIALVESLLSGGHSPAYFAVLDEPMSNAAAAWRDDPAAFSRYPDFVLAHEMAHQWWGQAVGWRNYHEQWLSEGFAQYFAALYAQHERGDETFASVLRQMRKWSLDETDQGPVYIGYRVGHIRGDARAFHAIVYDKGALVLHMLRRLVGDEAFFGGIRRFYAEMRFDQAGTDDLRRAMEAESGQSLDRFFERWIYGSTLPHLIFTSRVERSEAGPVALVRFEQVGDLFDVPVTVTLAYADHRKVDVVVPVTERVVERRVPLDGPLRSIDVSRDDGTLAEVATR
jgi:hypothetical protein